MVVPDSNIVNYLSDVKTAISAGNYRIEKNGRRQDNLDLFIDYVIDEEKCKEILLSLTAEDFSKIVQNEHKGFEHEQLYVFGKDVELLYRFDEGTKTVPLYIKFNKLESHFIIVISFHEQRYPLNYPFK